jgi:hypothetical protein
VVPAVSYRAHLNLDGFHESGALVAGVELRLPGGARVRPSFEAYREGLLQPFAITPTITLPRGRYTWSQGTVDFGSDETKPISGAVRLELGGRYNGHSYGGAAVVNLRPLSAWTVSVVAEYEDVRLRQGDLTRSRAGVRVRGGFGERLTLNVLGQYDNESATVGVNAMAGWTLGFGTTLHLVFNEAKVAEGLFEWRRPKNRSISLKVSQRLGPAY